VGAPGALAYEAAGSTDAGATQANKQDVGVVGQAWFAGSWWTMAGFALMLWSYKLVGWVSVYPALVPLVILTSAWGLLAVASAWVTPRRLALAHWVKWIRWGTVILTLVGFAAWAAIQVYQAPGYGTDEMAFDQYAAQLMAHGIDPYTRSMGPAFPLFHVQPDGYTYQLNGTAVTSLSYPSLAFLVYVPLLLLGVSTQLAVGFNIVAWAIAILVLLALLPSPMRPMALVVGGLSVYGGYAIGGVTVALYVPLLAGAVFAWRRWSTLRGWRSWVGPVLMGMAISINQLPWFVFPFLVAGIACEAAIHGGRRAALRTGARYVAMVGVVVAVPNIPFVVWHPSAWLHGILTPITSATVPAGQGLIELSLYLHLGGGSLTAYSALSVLALAACLAGYVAYYSRLRALVAVLPAIPLLLATRSYDSYLFGLVPAALIAAVTVYSEPAAIPRTARRGPHDQAAGGYMSPPRFRLAKVAAGGLGLATLAAGLAAVTIPSPLTISIQSVTTTGQLATVSAVTVAVHNRSHSTLQPHFSLSSSDAVTTFWLVNSGPATIKAGQTAVYNLLAPNFPAQPSINGGFQVIAFTSSPDTVSHSGSYLPTTDHLALNPDAVNHDIPIGQAVVVTAELLDRLNRPIHKAAVPVYLGQVVYAQTGLVYGEAIINGSQPGQTPVSALTNADGVATFTIIGTHASNNPVYFEANLVNSRSFYPYGYSQILPVRFNG